MVLSSAAASTQTTILPTARTTLSMAVYKALPRAFARMHGTYLTPTVSTIVMGAISIALYIPLNYLSGGNVIADAVTAIGLYIAFYYGLTAFTCVWYYRRTLFSSPRNLFMRGIFPLLGGLIMYFAGGWSIWLDWDVATQNSFTSWLMPFWPHWEIGGVFMIAFLSALVGVIAFIYCRITLPAYFRKETLTRSHPDPGPRNRPRPPRLAELAVLDPGPRCACSRRPPGPPAALRARAVVRRRHTGRSPGRGRLAGPVASASPWLACGYRRQHRPLAGPRPGSRPGNERLAVTRCGLAVAPAARRAKARLAGPVMSGSP